MAGQMGLYILAQCTVFEVRGTVLASELTRHGGTTCVVLASLGTVTCSGYTTVGPANRLLDSWYQGTGVCLQQVLHVGFDLLS